jgi:hypothetical protein
MENVELFFGGNSLDKEFYHLTPTQRIKNLINSRFGDVTDFKNVECPRKEITQFPSITLIHNGEIFEQVANWIGQLLIQGGRE